MEKMLSLYYSKLWPKSQSIVIYNHERKFYDLNFKYSIKISLWLWHSLCDSWKFNIKLSDDWIRFGYKILE